MALDTRKIESKWRADTSRFPSGAMSIELQWNASMTVLASTESVCGHVESSTASKWSMMSHCQTSVPVGLISWITQPTTSSSGPNVLSPVRSTPVTTGSAKTR